MRSTVRWIALAAIAAAVSLVHAGGALAQTPSQVTGLAAVQEDGFATLSWDPVDGATDYQVERTPVDGADQPTGPGTIVGLWQPTRTVTPDAPTFAESGFVLGERFCWRVRARFASVAQPFSEPVCGTTRAQWGVGPGASLRTQFEQTNGASYTSDVTSTSTRPPSTRPANACASWRSAARCRAGLSTCSSSAIPSRSPARRKYPSRRRR